MGVAGVIFVGNFVRHGVILIFSFGKVALDVRTRPSPLSMSASRHHEATLAAPFLLHFLCHEVAFRK